MANTGATYPSWGTFLELVETGEPAAFAIGGTRDIQLFVTDRASSIGLRVPAGTSVAPIPSPLEDVEVELVQVRSQFIFEILCRKRGLFEQFYALLISIVDRLISGQALETALRESLARWHQLLIPVSLLADSDEIGLWGELWLLERLVRHAGGMAVEAWTGPFAEPHDFRIGPVEIEVKTTTSTRRAHIIDGLNQLVPSVDHRLFLLSIQIEPPGAGAGSSLPGMVEQVRRLIAADSAGLAMLGDGLSRIGYRDEKAALYNRRWQLRTEPRLIVVDDSVPALTPVALSILGVGYAQRVHDVHYRLDVDGLGDPDGTDAFLAVLPNGDPRSA